MNDDAVSGGSDTPSAPIPSQAQTWVRVLATGPLTLARSNAEFALYDTKNTFGKWPLTEEGERYARETYEAHRQSLAHGVAYSATGYQDPERLGLPVEPALKSQTYAAPLSYVGSTRRIVGWAKKAAVRNAGLNTLVWVVAAISLLLVWVFLLGWYFVIFGIFGVFVFPYRLIRRSQRKSQHVQRQTLATQQAMYQQMARMQQPMTQQQAMTVQPPASPPLQPPAPPQIPPQP